MTTSYAWAVEKRKAKLFNLKVSPLTVPAPPMITNHPKFDSMNHQENTFVPYINLQEIDASALRSNVVSDHHLHHVESQRSDGVSESSFTIPGAIESVDDGDCEPIINNSEIDTTYCGGASLVRSATVKLRNSPIMTLLPASPRSPRSPERKLSKKRGLFGVSLESRISIHKICHLIHYYYANILLSQAP